MNKSQAEGRARGAKGKVKESSCKGHSVLADLNDESGKRGGKGRTKSGEDRNRNAGKHGGKHRTILGDVNDDNKE